VEGCANALEILVPEHRALRIAGGSPTSGAVGGVCDSRVLRAPEPDGHAARGQARKKKSVSVRESGRGSWLARQGVVFQQRWAVDERASGYPSGSWPISPYLCASLRAACVVVVCVCTR